jgi:hypothetical protein
MRPDPKFVGPDPACSLDMSALPPKADIRCAEQDVRSMPAFSNSKIKIGRLVYGYSNLTWASPYKVLRTK